MPSWHASARKASDVFRHNVLARIAPSRKEVQVEETTEQVSHFLVSLHKIQFVTSVGINPTGLCSNLVELRYGMGDGY